MANAFLVDLNNMQPVYTDFCIKSVQSAVQTQISQMQIVAKSCKDCPECAGLGYKIPPFINDTCSIPEEVGGFLTRTFNNASSALAQLESAWEIYRDDAIGKTNYLATKIFNINDKYTNLEQILNDYQGKIPLDFNKINSLVIEDYYSKILTLSSDFYDSLSKFDDSFMNQTDQLILISNQKIREILIANLNHTQCLDGLLNDKHGFFYYLHEFSGVWSFRMNSLFYITEVDAALSAAFSEISNFANFVGNCVNGNPSLIISCLNQVKKFPIPLDIPMKFIVLSDHQK